VDEHCSSATDLTAIIVTVVATLLPNPLLVNMTTPAQRAQWLFLPYMYACGSTKQWWQWPKAEVWQSKQQTSTNQMTMCEIQENT